MDGQVTIQAQPLRSETFSPYGDVIELKGAEHFPINNGDVERYHDLATVTVDSEKGGRPLISVMETLTVHHLPLKVTCIEQHPLGSQAFIPLHSHPFLVVVALAGDTVDPSQLKAFISDGKQGVNYHPGTWHVPLISSQIGQQVLIVDRGGPGNNCHEIFFQKNDIYVSI